MNSQVSHWTLLCVVIGLLVVIFSRCSQAPNTAQAQAPRSISAEGIQVQRYDMEGACYIYRVVVDGHSGAFAACSENGVPIFLK